MNETEANELSKAIVHSMEKDKKTTWFGEGKFCIFLFLKQLYKEGFEISVRKKK